LGISGFSMASGRQSATIAAVETTAFGPVAIADIGICNGEYDKFESTLRMPFTVIEVSFSQKQETG
jgi:hypothetical protein